MFVRRVVNKSGNVSVQVVKKINRQNKIIKHIGTAQSPLELNQLIDEGHKFIAQQRIKSGVISFFDTRFEKSKLEQLLDNFSFSNPIDKLTYLFFNHFYKKIGFNKTIKDKCFEDLTVVRITAPASRSQMRETLETKFGIAYSLSKIDRTFRKAVKNDYRLKVEKTIRRFVLRKMVRTISIAFFDVTTLYYEAFDEDDFRRCGYSKDGKNNQPQIVVALAVTASGIPLTVHSFEGNKFEGHTLLPCILDLIARFKIRRKDFIVVADAAMLSVKNLKLLEENKIKYIVGARLGNLKEKVLNEVSKKITKIDGNTIRINLDNGSNGRLGKSDSGSSFKKNGKTLVVSYSVKRAAKDKHDREKQLNKAKLALSSGSPTKRYKYLSAVAKGKYQINEKLIEKSIKLEGLKGYVTNASGLTNDEIIQKYSDLWLVEKAFRMSKSDLKARPIFSTVRESIEAHLTLVFTALTVSRYTELLSGKTIAKMIKILNPVKQITVKDKVTGDQTVKFTDLTSEAEQLLKLTKTQNTFGSLK